MVTYAEAGVDIGRENLVIKSIVSELRKTLSFRKNKVGESLTDIGHFSGLVRLDEKKALALSADGVGTKILVAEALQKYDTIGIDLVAMNANDIICTGAEPLTMLDYLAVDESNPDIAKEIGKGLVRGAEIAGISISGGEVATVPEIVNGLDLAGMVVGIVDIDRVITGDKIRPGDCVVGVESSGIHSNGLTLARKVLLENHDINEKLVGNKTVGEELLTPTRIYVREVLKLIKTLDIKGLANITGGGLHNLERLMKYGVAVDNPPEPQKVFKVIQEEGNVPNEEMYRTFNMGVGFCVITKEEDADKVMKLCRKFGTDASVIGRVVDERGVKVKW